VVRPIQGRPVRVVAGGSLSHNSGSVAARLLAGATRVEQRHVNAERMDLDRHAHRYRVHEDSILVMRT